MTLASVKLAVVNLVGVAKEVAAEEAEVVRDAQEEDAEEEVVESETLLAGAGSLSEAETTRPFPRPAAAMHFSFVVRLISGWDDEEC